MRKQQRARHDHLLSEHNLQDEDTKSNINQDYIEPATDAETKEATKTITQIEDQARCIITDTSRDNTTEKEKLHQKITTPYTYTTNKTRAGTSRLNDWNVLENK